MRTISTEEKYQIKNAKCSWLTKNKERKLFRSNSISDINKLIELSDYANNLIKKK
jgi:hypothetical protein